MTSCIRCYLKEVSKALCCKRKEKRAILSKVQYDIEVFAEEYSHWENCDLSYFFGTPKEAAQRYMQYAAECVEWEKSFFRPTSA